MCAKLVGKRSRLRFYLPPTGEPRCAMVTMLGTTSATKMADAAIISSRAVEVVSLVVGGSEQHELIYWRVMVRHNQTVARQLIRCN